MVQIGFVDAQGAKRTVEISHGETLMQAAVQNGIREIVAECEGNCACATCHVYISNEWAGKLPIPSEGELEMLEGALEPDERSRLACQIVVGPELEGMIVLLPESQI